MNQIQSIFFQNTVVAAQQAQKEFGVPSSITIAQATLESGWGQSALARQANNYFGIKANAKAQPAEYMEFPTEEFVDGRKVQEVARFERFSSPIASFKAHGYLLNMALRYRPAMAVKGDPEKFAQALQDCGYSTNPDYAAKLMQIVRQFDLTQYDVPAAPAKVTS